MEKTSAEKRREERRQKILNNRESRFKKILGENSSEEQIQNLLKSSSIDEDDGISHEEISGIGDTQIDPPVNPVGIKSNPPKVIEDKSESNSKPNETRLPILPFWLHKLILFLLGMSLPLLGGNYFLIYFFAWETAFVILRKGEEELNTSAMTGVIINIAFIFFKIPEEWRTRIKVTFKQTIQIMSDLSLFVASSLLISVFIPLFTKYPINE